MAKQEQEPTPTTLKPAQQRRVLALKEARGVLAAQQVFGSPATDSFELIRVAEYIVEGEV